MMGGGGVRAMLGHVQQRKRKKKKTLSRLITGLSFIKSNFGGFDGLSQAEATFILSRQPDSAPTRLIPSAPRNQKFFLVSLETLQHKSDSLSNFKQQLQCVSWLRRCPPKTQERVFHSSSFIGSRPGFPQIKVGTSRNFH